MPYQTISCLVHIWHLEYGHQPKQNKTTNLPLLLQLWRLLFGSLTSTVSNFVVTLFYTSRNGDTPPWMLLSLSLTIQKVWIEHLFLSGISFEILFPLIFLWWHGSVSVKLNFFCVFVFFCVSPELMCQIWHRSQTWKWGKPVTYWQQACLYAMQ